MADLDLKEISEKMRDIDFAVLSTRTEGGALAGRPMSNNREVEYAGTSWFFTYEQHRSVADIERDASIGLSHQGKAGLKGLVGAPGIFIHVEAEARLIRDKARFAEHWDKELDMWFPQGMDTPGIVMIEARAKRIHYWSGKDEGEVRLPGAV